MSHLKDSTRQLFNQATRTGDGELCETAFACHKKEIRMPELFSWSDYCQGNKAVSERSILTRILAGQ